MKKIILAVAGSMLLTIWSCNSQSGNKKVELTSDLEKASYALGMNIGSNLVQQGLDTALNVDCILAGIKDQINKNTQLDINETEQILNTFFTQLQQSQFKGKIEEGEKFLAENKKRDGVITTESGLQYEILVEGKGEKPVITSTVKTHYKGTLLNGSVFDSSYDSQPVSFPLNGVIRGWTEALQLMPVGSKWKIYLPYDLAYGERSAGQLIGPYETLVFEIELLEIEK